MKVTYSDWFLPSKDELDMMYDNLKVSGVGGFFNTLYWSSFEQEASGAWFKSFNDGTRSVSNKNTCLSIRAARSFVSATIYALRDSGPAGGWIFHIIDNLDGTFTYYECASEDLEPSIWSNVNEAIGTLSDAIGEGVNNTAEIIAQVGHTTSAAKFCADYSNYVILDSDISKGDEATEELDDPITGGSYNVQSDVNYLMACLYVSADSKGRIEYQVADEWYEWEYGNIIESRCINIGKVKAVRQVNLRGTTKLEIRAV